MALFLFLFLFLFFFSIFLIPSFSLNLGSYSTRHKRTAHPSVETLIM